MFVMLANAALSGALSMGSAQAQNDVYVCTDGSGAKEYKNTGLTKGCKKLELSGISVPTPVSPPKRAAGSAGDNAAKNIVAAASFPTVDSGMQKARDNDRKLLLQDELKTEQGKLAALRSDFNQGEPERRDDERNHAKYQERVAVLKDEIARSERNVEALRRELGKLR